MFRDTHLVIVCVTAITICALFKLGDVSKEIITNAFSGMFGLVTGYSMHAIYNKLEKGSPTDGTCVANENQVGRESTG